TTDRGAGLSQWSEHEVIDRTSGLIPALTERLARLSGVLEKEGIDRVGGLIPVLTERLARLSASLEQALFQRGVHVGMPRASAAAARVLLTTEEVLGRPLVFAGLIFVSLFLASIGALLLASP
ncbi:MAG: hypothetical protein H0V71_03735, partial [Chloroflexi bacterium]|nr:hypothetical protein [Chloroflexota bacterium]